MAREHTAALPRARMLGTVFAKTLREQRRSLVWWALGLVAASLLTTVLYPSVRENAAELARVLESMPEGLRRALLGTGDFFSAEGYLQARMFSTFAPLLLLVFSIGAGSRAIAGEEERRTLDLLLSLPITRRRVLLDKAGAMVVGTVGLGAVLWVAIAASGPAFELHVGAGALAAAAANGVLLALVFGTTALSVGAASGRRALATGVATGFAAGAYLIDVLALSVGGLGWLQRLSPFFYYRDPGVLSDGFDPGAGAVLVALAATAVWLGAWAFERRDVRT